MASESQDHLPDGSLLAAIDIGSNSFHLIIAKIEHGEMRTQEVLAEKVQLGAGLKNHRLSAEAIARGLECLARFAQLISSAGPTRIRAVGTNALRQAHNRAAFTQPAADILGTKIDVIYGREEARLVYLGVAHTLADDAQSRLVVDIGGGSTEFIIGERFEPKRLESLQMGCVSYGRKYFPDGLISEANYRRAYDRARVEVAHIHHRYHSGHWMEAVGSSGTLNAINAIVTQNGWSDGNITRKSLEQLERKLLKFSHFDEIKLEGLPDTRRNVILAGTAITTALFDILGVEQMRTSRGALREGVIYDLMGRLSHEDVRERTISALMQRYNVDLDSADIVERRCRMLVAVCRGSWKLDSEDWELLLWAARTHEIGMAISHKHFNRHTAYLLRNSDLPGFSQEEQEALALLTQGQRGKLPTELLEELPKQQRRRALYLLAILRLAVRLRHVEFLEALPEFGVVAEKLSLSLGIPEGWLEEHPLTAAELEQERSALGKLDFTLSFH